MLSNIYLQKNYTILISSVKEWKKFDKKSTIRFRINYVSKYGGMNCPRGEKCFNKMMREFVDSDFNFYTAFLAGNNILKPYYDKVEDFLIRNKIIIIKMVYGHLAGLKFPDKKTKEIFLLKYSDIISDQCIIK